MKTKFISLLILSALLIPALSSAQGKDIRMGSTTPGVHEPGTGLENPELKAEMQGNATSTARRSMVANAIQEMEMIANRAGGIGDQIRVIAQSQNKTDGEAEDALTIAQQRRGFARFFVGPNYTQLKTVEDRLQTHTQNMEQLKTLRDQVQNASDKANLDKQIQVMEEVKTELENSVAQEQKGFSLFGWLNRLINK